MNGIDAVFSICFNASGSTLAGGRNRTALSLTRYTTTTSATAFVPSRAAAVEDLLHAADPLRDAPRAELLAAWRSAQNRGRRRFHHHLDAGIVFVAKRAIHRRRILETDPVRDDEGGIDVAAFDA